MSDNRAWTFGRKAMLSSLVVGHIWGTLLIAGVLTGRDSNVIGEMFSTVGFMIFSTLGVLVGGKAWKEFAPLKWGSQQEEGQNYGDNSHNFMGEEELEAGFDDRSSGGGRVAGMDDLSEGTARQGSGHKNRGRHCGNQNHEETE